MQASIDVTSAAIGLVLTLVLNALIFAYSYGALNAQAKEHDKRLDRIEKLLAEVISAFTR